MKIEGTIGVTSIKAADINNANINNNGNIDINLNQEAVNNEKRINDFNENILNKAMEQANKELESMNRCIERHIHEKTKTIVYRIIDTQTKEVIKEFPPEKIQDMIAKMWELAGLFVDERA